MSDSGSATGDTPSGGLLGLIARLLLGAAFLYLGYLKAQDPVAFLKVIREYEMAPESMPRLMTWIAAVLPWMEMVCGLLLVLGIGLRGTSLLLLVLLVVFTGAILMRARGIQAEEGLAFCSIEFDCGCGTGVVPVCRKLVENGILLLASCVVLISGARRFALRARLFG